MIEPIVKDWVSGLQRGFLPGRSMLANIVDIDFHSMTISLKHSRGAVILFDFAAAFPSLSQEYMWHLLAHIGLPREILLAIQRLYMNNLHFIKVRSSIFTSFSATSGVRQGCPPSRLLSAVVADLLLRRLEAKLPGAVLRAFADDTAAVVPDSAKCAATIMAISKELGAIANLELNMKKTVLIPLWESTALSVQKWIRNDLPNWADVQITWAAKYLGYFVGSDRETLSWNQAMQRFNTRVTAWTELHLGMFLNARIY